MKIRTLIKTSLFALALVAPLGACDGGDEETTGEETAETDDTTETTTGEPSEDVTCATFCVQYIELGCIGTEFTTDAECQTACAEWDQEGANCRYEQMVNGMCDQAGDMGDAC